MADDVMEMVTYGSARVYQDDDGSWHFFINGAEVSADEFEARGFGHMSDDLRLAL